MKNLYQLLIKLLSVNPAKLLNIYNRKGSLEVGKDADFLVWDPMQITKVNRKNIYLKHHNTFLFKHHKFFGEISHTFVRGNMVFNKEEKSF